ncbi:hypothetical protein ACIQRS_01055 [Streptomyces termitum]|uniref:Uncharacterized protein n=1 Tax=Streptomyces termitum TaxID=67368 RepID=A0A918W5M9_9ACTN|nr:hypothetical protein [Streptomyces termitum]GHA74674.1 hypothetical protein GCM10010305_16880 [Streptomyces termitum]
MFVYELHRAEHAELVREAAAQRLGREAARAARGRRTAGRESEREASTGKDRYATTA